MANDQLKGGWTCVVSSVVAVVTSTTAGCSVQLTIHRGGDRRWVGVGLNGLQCSDAVSISFFNVKVKGNVNLNMVVVFAAVAVVFCCCCCVVLCCVVFCCIASSCVVSGCVVWFSEANRSVVYCIGSGSGSVVQWSGV